MPLPAPKPVDALRQHTRAVVLISADGEASPSLLDAIRDSEIPCELIGHPLVAMAELVRLEKDNRHHSERTALFVADDERIEQLSPLFAAVRSRLPQVAIWVIAGEFAVQVQRATVQDPTGSPITQAAMPQPPGSTTPQRTRAHGGPMLRIVDPADDEAGPPHPRAAVLSESNHGNSNHGNSNHGNSNPGGSNHADAPRPDLHPRDALGTDHLRTDHAVEVKTTGSDPRGGRGENPRVDAEDPATDPEAGAHSTKLTAEELDMLLGWDEHDASEHGTSGDGGRR